MSALLASWPAVVVPAPLQAHTQEAAFSAGALEGTVVDRQTRRPIASATVLIESSALAVASDSTGRFQIDLVPVGTHVLRVEAPGYAALWQGDVRVSRGRITVVTLELSAASPSFAAEVTVRASAFEKPSGVTTTSYGVAYEEVRRSVGAVGDLNRHLQSLPGLTHTTDQRNDLIARGGSPSENLTLVDGFEVPSLSHFSGQGTGGGVVSMLNNELLGDATFLAGGFPARFGNRLSSVLDVRLREGNRDRFEAETDVSFAGASLVLEGPVGSRGSWIGSVRQSYLDLLKSPLGLTTVPKYGSYQAKIVYDIDESNRVWVLGLGGYDSYKVDVDQREADDPSLEGVRNRGWRVVHGVAWRHLFGKHGYGRLTVSDAVMHYGAEVHDRQLADQLTFRDESQDHEVSASYDLAWRFREELTLEAGGGVKRGQSDLRIAQPLGVQNPLSPEPGRVDPVQVDKTIVAHLTSGYAQMSARVVPRARLTFGLRVDRFDYLDATRVSPRAGLSVDLAPRVNASLSAGRYYQQPDLVFVGASPINRSLDPIRADHLVAGIAYVPNLDLKVSVEAYQKDYADYPVSLDYPTLSLASLREQSLDYGGVGGLLFPMTSQGKGRARGVELFLQKKLTRALYGQVSYSVSRTRHAALDGTWRPGAFDSPQTFATILGYRLEPRWEFSTRFTYASGRPYTPALIDASRDQNRWIDDLTRVNAARLPGYHRLDLRADRTFGWGRSNVALYIEVQNVYNRENVAAYDWNPNTRQPNTEKQLGLLPVFGINVEF